METFGSFDHYWLRAITAALSRARTPFFLFRGDTIAANLEGFADAFAMEDRRVAFFYSIKTNPARAIASIINDKGWGFLASSLRDLQIAKRVRARAVLFDAPTKTRDEVKFAAEKLNAQIVCENELDLARTMNWGRHFGVKQIGVRIMVPRSVSGHSSRFGFDLGAPGRAQVRTLLEKASSAQVTSLHFHLGGKPPAPLSFYRLADFASQVWVLFREQGCPIHALNFGGGVPCSLPKKSLCRYAGSLRKGLSNKVPQSVDVCLEPGRAIVENAAVFCVEVKDISIRDGQAFALVDGGSNSVMPTWMTTTTRLIAKLPNRRERNVCHVKRAIVVGPLCAETDILGAVEDLSGISVGDRLAMWDVGAYDWSTKFDFGRKAVSTYLFSDSSRFRNISATAAV